MYPQDGNGWQSSRPQESRGGGGGEPYPESYPFDNNLHQGSSFQPNSAAFEYMRGLQSQSGGGTPPPPPQREYPQQQQRGQSPPPSDHSPPNPASGRHSRTPRRMRRTTRAAGAAATTVDTPGPPGAASRIISDTPMSMPSNRPILMTGPVQSGEMNRSAGPAAASMPGVGVGVYDDEPMAPNRAHAPSTSPYDTNPPAPPGGLHHEQSDGSYMPAAPYQNMMQNFNNSVPDPTVERARNLMAGHSDNNSSGPDSRPMPIAGRPLPPSTHSVEPSVPPAQLRRRILTNKPKREPDLVRGKVVQQIQSSKKKTHVLCAGCGVMLQISKTAIVVHCRNCNGVHPTASCHVPSSHA